MEFQYSAAIIIRDVFKGTVKRWDEQVKIRNLNDIAWTNEVADEICLLQDDISRLIDAHSTSDEFGGGMPEPDDLEKLIARVWVHGHTHDSCDYWVGSTRIVCNPVDMKDENVVFDPGLVLRV